MTEWEGSAVDGRVLHDALHRDDGFTIPRGMVISLIVFVWYSLSINGNTFYISYLTVVFFDVHATITWLIRDT